MSKNNKAVKKALQSDYKVAKVDGKWTFTLGAALRTTAVKAATDIDKLIDDYTPIALNLWSAYKAACLDKNGPLLTQLQFFSQFHDSIPQSWPKVGSPARKALNSNRLFNRLNYLVFDIGRTEAGDNPKSPSPKERKQKLAKKKANFKSFCVTAKLEAKLVKALILEVLGMKTKDGKLTKMGKTYYELVVDTESDD